MSDPQEAKGSKSTALFRGGPLDGRRVERATLPATIEIPGTSAAGKLAMLRYRKVEVSQDGLLAVYRFD